MLEARELYHRYRSVSYYCCRPGVASENHLEAMIHDQNVVVKNPRLRVFVDVEYKRLM